MSEHTITCTHENCERAFLTDTAMIDHANAVHTFDDIRRQVSDAVRDKWGQKGDYQSRPIIPSIYTYIVDIADDWCVFEREGTPGSDLWKVSYSVVDGLVTLGEPTQVVRRTVYVAAPEPKPIA